MTPDLRTEVRSDKLTRERAKELSKASEAISNGLGLWSTTEPGLFRRTSALEIPELHEYLTDAADWDADTWDFEEEGRARLARTLGWLYERMPEAFRFSATWGPVTIDERDVDRDELLAIVEGNAVSTTTIYNVRST